MNTFALFPTPVSFFKFPRELTEEELKFAKEQARTPNMGNETSAARKIFQEPLMKEISDFVQQCVDEYFESIHAPLNDVRLEFTQSWFNYTKPGQYHHKHNHSNSFVSGCFYISANKEKDKIYFFKEENHPLSIENKEYNLYNSSSWWLPVGSLDVVLFPSNLTHMVETVQDDESRDERISIAFNTFLKGYLGNDDKLTGLHL